MSVAQSNMQVNKHRSIEKGQLVHSVFVDEDHEMLGGNVDEITYNTIINGEYFDFSTLLSKDRLSIEDDKCMEMINRNGLTYWVPVSDKEGNTINSFHKWEQAFRVYSKIYTETFPSRASKLIQYGYTIQTASATFVWDNVYAYDRDFRIHLSRHPERTWSVILQQAWTLRMKDRIGTFGNRNGQNKGNSGNKNICYKYNRGRCSFGFNCKFDHKCSICGKFGHGAYNCQKASGAAKREWVSDRETGESRWVESRNDRD